MVLGNEEVFRGSDSLVIAKFFLTFKTITKIKFSEILKTISLNFCTESVWRKQEKQELQVSENNGRKDDRPL